MMPTHLGIRVDDAETGLIQYSTGHWSQGGLGSEFSITTHWTLVPGASFTFKFNGTSVTVFGTISPLPPPAKSTYILDNSTAVTFTASPNGNWQYQQVMYQSPSLSRTEHTLVVTSVDQLTRLKNEFLVDYVQYQTEHPISRECQNSGNQGTSVGAIIGSAAGGLAFILIVLGLVLLHRRRNSAFRGTLIPTFLCCRTAAITNDPFTVTPFVAPAVDNSSSNLESQLPPHRQLGKRPLR